MVMASSVPSSSPLSKLKDMNLWDIEDDGGSLPDGWVLNLNSLKSLGIINYLYVWSHAISDLPWGAADKRLRWVRSIKWHGCWRWWHGMETSQFPPYSVSPNFQSWNLFLQVFNMLPLWKISLTISDCPNLIGLPEWISEFTSLEYLGFTRCSPNLTSLPDVILQFTKANKRV